MRAGQKIYQIDVPDGSWCHQARAGEGGGPSQGLVAPRAIGYIRQQAFFGVFFSTGIPTLSYFLGGVERGHGGPTARSWKVGRFAGTGAGRLGGFI